LSEALKGALQYSDALEIAANSSSSSPVQVNIDMRPPATSQDTPLLPHSASTTLSVGSNDTILPSECKRKRKRGEKDKQAYRDRRRKRREAMPPTGREPRMKAWPDPPQLRMALNPSVDLPVTSTGFTAKHLAALKPYEHWTPSELRDHGFEEILWDGKLVVPSTPQYSLCLLVSC
jgi:hypothetical protein